VEETVTIRYDSDMSSVEGHYFMQHTRSALRKTVRAVAHDCRVLAPFLGAGAVGAATGVVGALVVVLALVVPKVREQATTTAEIRSLSRLRTETETAYTRGALDLIEGRLTVEEKLERAFVVMRNARGEVSRVPLDTAMRDRIVEEGWDFQEAPTKSRAVSAKP
jgi:hypothetical protein